MKFKRLLMIFLVPLFFVSCAGEMSDSEKLELSVNYVEALFSGDYKFCRQNSSYLVRQAFKPKAAQQVVDMMEDYIGDYSGVLSSETNSRGTVHVEVSGTYASMTLKIAFNRRGKVRGFNLVQINSLDTIYNIPDYADESLFSETEVIIGEGTDFELEGTLTVPINVDEFPIIVLVQGSGSSDRNESIGPNKPFQDLAWGLASHGVAVLRYDKRSYVYPEAFSEADSYTTEEELEADARLALTLAAEREGVTEVYLAGHSLGGMMAPRIASESEAVDGVILLAAPAEKLYRIVVDQSEYLADSDGKRDFKEKFQIGFIRFYVKKIEKGKLNEEKPKRNLFGQPAAYWQDMKEYDQVETARNLDLPLLFLNGERDYQVTLERDFSAWQSALSDNENAEFESFENLNHLFIPGTGDPNPDEYMKESHVSESVIQRISEFVL